MEALLLARWLRRVTILGLIFCFLTTAARSVFAEQKLPNTILGDDDRKKLDLSKLPWIGKIGPLMDEAPVLKDCSAIAISPRFVLTAGHCVASWILNTFAEKHTFLDRVEGLRFEFALGYNRKKYAESIFGTVVAAGRRVYAPARYGHPPETHTIRQFIDLFPSPEEAAKVLEQTWIAREDWAVVYLDKNLSTLSTFLTLEDVRDSQEEIFCAGYPGDKKRGEQAFVSKGRMLNWGMSSYDQSGHVDCDSSPGVSGGPIYVRRDKKLSLVGMNVSFDEKTRKFQHVLPLVHIRSLLQELIHHEATGTVPAYLQEQIAEKNIYFLF